MLLTVLNFVVRTVFIRELGVEYLGIGGLFANILQLLSLTELGMDTAINFKLYKPLAERDEHRVRVLMKFYKQAYRCIGLVIMLLGIALIPSLPYLIKDYDNLAVLKIDASAVFVLYLLQSVSSYLFFAYKSSIIKTAQKSYYLNVVDYAVNIAQSAVQIAILIVLHDFMLYILTVVVFNVVRNFVNALVAERMFKYAFIKEKDSISSEEVKGILKDCMALFVYKVNSVVLKATDNIVLSSFIGLAVVGLYSNYLLIYMTIKKFLNQLYSSVKASLGNMYATSTVDRFYFMFEVMNYVTVVLYGTACVGIGVCANELIEVWLGAGFTIPQPFPMLIGLELLFAGLKTNLGQIRNVTGAFRQMWYRPVAGIIINLVVSVIGVKIWGIFGVIAGTITSDLLTNFMVDPIVIHKYSFGGYRSAGYYYQKNVVYLLVLTLCCCADWTICRALLPEPTLLSLLIHITICGLSVPMLFLGLYWRSEVCRYLTGNVKSILNRRH